MNQKTDKFFSKVEKKHGIKLGRFVKCPICYRMWEQQVDFDNFAKIYEAVETSFIEKEGDSDSPE